MAIPKIIHFLWMSETKDEKTEACLASWREHLGDYEIREWNGSSFPYQDFVWTREAVEAKSWAYVTDYFRLWVLYNYGGIYLDADVMLQGNFDGYLECKVFIGTEFTSQLGAHCIGCEAGSTYIKECLEFYRNRHFIQPDGSHLILPIPRIMTYILMKKYGYTESLANFEDKPIVVDEVSIFPDNHFTIDIADGKNVGVHLGLGSWRVGEWKRSQPVYSELLQQYFIKRYYLYDIFRRRRNRKVLRAVVPNILVTLYLRFALKIKHIKRITDIGKL